MILRIDERIVVVYLPLERLIGRIKREVMLFLMSLEELRSLMREDFDMEELLHIHRDGLNSELSEEHPRHESINIKEANADDEHDEGLGLLESAEKNGAFKTDNVNSKDNNEQIDQA